MWEFNQSLKYDKRMHAEDIQGSIAYAKALRRANVLTGKEEEQLISGLRQVGEEWKSGKVNILFHCSNSNLNLIIRIQ